MAEVVSFDWKKETKNTQVFQEREGEEPPIVGTLYMQNWAWRRLGSPKHVVVHIAPGELATDLPGDA